MDKVTQTRSTMYKMLPALLVDMDSDHLQSIGPLAGMQSSCLSDRVVQS